MRLLLLLGIWVFGTISPLLSEKPTFVFAPLPMEKVEEVMRQYRPMLDYIGEELGWKIRMSYSTDYGEMLRKITSGKVDFAYLGPLPYVMLKEQYPHIKPLVRFLNSRGEEFYTCSLMVRDDEDILGLEQLKGHKIALTQPLSTCGYLMSASMLNTSGIDIKTMPYYYAGSHANSVLSVVLGEADIGGMKTAIGRRYRHLGVHLIARSKPLPGFVLVANTKTVGPDVQQKLQSLLLGLDPFLEPDDAFITRLWGKNLRNGCVPANDQDFLEIKKLLRKFPIPQKDVSYE